MKWGTFIGINHQKRTVTGANTSEMMMEEYMAKVGIRDPRDVIGPFETVILDKYDGVKCPWEGEALHTVALKMAREEQVKLSAKLKKASA